MNLRLTAVIASALALWAGAAGLAEPPRSAATPALESRSLFTLEEALRQAAKRNPEIRAARRRRDAARSQVAAERTWEKPRVSYERMYSGAEELYGVSQEIPFPGKLRSRGRVAERAAESADRGYQAKRLQVRAETKSAYSRYFLAVQSIAIFQENAELLRRFAKAAESKYAVGKASQADVLRAQVELSKMLNELVTLEQEKETARALLNVLMNHPPETPMGAPEVPRTLPVKHSLEDLQALALASRPELLAARSEFERGVQAESERKLDYWPDFMAEFKQRRSDDPAMDGSRDVGVSVSLPLWFWRQRSEVKAAEAEREMGAAEYEAAKNATLFGVKDLLVKLRASDRLITLYETSVIPQAEQALKISEAAYRSDRGSFLELLDAQRNLLQFRVEHYEHMAEYEMRAAELERMVGKDLEEEQP